MSVVNQMLKDLDKRQQPHNLAHVPIGQASQAANPWWLLLGGTLLGIILLALGLWLGGYLGDNNPSSSQTQNLSGSRTEPSQTVPYEPGPSGRHRLPQVVAGMSDDNRGLSPVPETHTSALQLPSKSLAPKLTSEESSELNAALNAQGPDSETNHSKAVSLNSNRAASGKLDTKAVSDIPAAKADARLEQQPEQEPAHSIQAESLGHHEASSRPADLGRQENTQFPGAEASKPSQAKMSVTQVSLTPAELSQKKLQQGLQAKELGQTDKAMSAFADALRSNDANHSARQELAALFYGRGELDKAAVLLRQGAERYPQQPVFWLLLARVQKARSELPLALASLQQIADGSELGREKWLLQAEIGQSLKDWPLVQQSYLSLIQQDASQGRWWLGLAYAQDASGAYDAAKASYQEALKRQGLSADARDYIENRLAQIGGRQ
ncbi:MSHA biogenesis protein MshN [Shewanella carassii]|uniref:tetratricopeptide repeat protein n=1 Tax=Shewanella carassii TaxID=1987584 RepID=UPI001BEFD00D|nr:tetratricopeptide repeat protein [Shewanella carassii]BCV68066.1 MSHA biogenesis protein MshN [Shewanella carassii]